MKQPTRESLNAERDALERQRAERLVQRESIERELAEAEQQCTVLSERREALRLAALAEKDASAADEFEAITRKATVTAIRRDDLAGVRGDLGVKLQKVDTQLGRLMFRSGLAELREMQEERQTIANEVDAAAEKLCAVLERFDRASLAMSRRALALGLGNGGRLAEPQNARVSILARISPDAPVVRLAPKVFRQPLADQVMGWAGMFDDREPPTDWKPDALVDAVRAEPSAA